MSAARMMAWWGGGVALFGLVLAGAGFAATDGGAATLLVLLGGEAAPFTPALRFATGLMGAVSLGWGVSLTALALATEPLDAATSRAIWRRMGIAIAVWFVIDSTISIATGFWPNVVSNVVLAVLFFAIQRRF